MARYAGDNETAQQRELVAQTAGYWANGPTAHHRAFADNQRVYLRRWARSICLPPTDIPARRGVFTQQPWGGRICRAVLMQLSRQSRTISWRRPFKLPWLGARFFRENVTPENWRFRNGKQARQPAAFSGRCLTFNGDGTSRTRISDEVYTMCQPSGTAEPKGAQRGKP